jgi:hypothetical protein
MLDRNEYSKIYLINKFPDNKINDVKELNKNIFMSI